MKIAFLHHSFILGSGTDSLIYQYAKRLGKRHEVEVLCFRTDYKESENFKISKVDIPFGDTRLGSGVFAPLLLPYRSLRQSLEQFDVVVTMLYPASLVPIGLGTKWVHIEWGVPEGLWLSWKERVYVQLAKLAGRVACKKADLVLTPSIYIDNWVLRHYGIHGERMYLDGIDFKLFNIDEHKSGNTPNILFVGRLSPHKNIETLIKAFGLVRSEIPNATLTIVGSHPFTSYYRSLLELVEQLQLEGVVSFEGVVSWESLPRYYAACAVFVSPSLWEGFMRCEAYAMGKPMVGFGCTSAPQTLNEGGISLSGLNFGSPESLAWPIIHLLLNKTRADRLGREGYEWAKTNLDLDIIVDNLEEVLSR